MKQTNNSNHIFIRVEVEVKTENTITIKETIRIDTDQITGQIEETEDNTGQDRGRPRYEKNFRRGNVRRNIRNYSRGEYRNNYRKDSYDRSRNKSRERSFSRNYGNSRTRSTSQGRLRSGSRARTNRDTIHCYKCREHDHFAKDCPTSREEGEIEQPQQMLNLGNEQLIIPQHQTGQLS